MVVSTELEPRGGRGERADLVVLRRQASVSPSVQEGSGPPGVGQGPEWWVGASGSSARPPEPRGGARGQKSGSTYPSWLCPGQVGRGPGVSTASGQVGPRLVPRAPCLPASSAPVGPTLCLSLTGSPSSLCLPKAAVSLLSTSPHPARPTFVFPAAPCEGKRKHRGV